MSDDEADGAVVSTVDPKALFKIVGRGDVLPLAMRPRELLAAALTAV